MAMPEQRTADVVQLYVAQEEYGFPVCSGCGASWQRVPAKNYKGYNEVRQHDEQCDFIAWLNEGGAEAS